MSSAAAVPSVPRWGKFEASWLSASPYADPWREVRLVVDFTAPSGAVHAVEAFWDGGTTWVIRFSPGEVGDWRFATRCYPADPGLHSRTGRFRCVAGEGTRFLRHGPLRVAANRRYLEHADGTPFFWLADTAWNGPLRAMPGEWDWYLAERTRQGFNAVQWVATQWLASPDGDATGRLAFTGRENIAVDPVFFQRLDARAEAVAQAGLLNVPVLLWSAIWSTPEANALNPGVFLSEEDAIRLARYLVARWSALPVVWMLAGDGDYRGARAERWRRIGRAVFGTGSHAPVMLHPAGMEWHGDEFRDEPWLDLLGYQSGHGDDAASLRWTVDGPPAHDWRIPPPRPILNLEPPYEDHIAHQSRQRIDAAMTRRAWYWSVLASPPAGVSYGGHGVWAWDDGSRLTPGHPAAGLPKPWREAMHLPGAEQIRHLAALAAAVRWWKLIPAPELLVRQPGAQDPRRHICAALADDRRLAVVYVPWDRQVELSLPLELRNASAWWFDPRLGAGRPTRASGEEAVCFTTPADGDWVLVVEGETARNSS